MSKREYRFRTRYRYPERIRCVGASPWTVMTYPWWKRTLRQIGLGAAAILVGFSLVFASPADERTLTPAPLLGAITFVDVTAWKVFIDAPTNTVTIPAGAASGDRMFFFGCWKDYLVNATLTDWNEVAEFADGTVASGAGTGSVKVGCWYKDHDGSEAAVGLTFSGGGLQISGGTIIAFRKDGGDTWEAPAAATAAIALATNWTATASTDPGITAGDVLIGFCAFRDDSATMTRNATTGLDATGITWASNLNESPATHLSTSSGQDISGDLGYRIASSGTASAAPTMSGTLAADETGAALWVRLRVSGGGGGGGDAFFENRHPIEQGMKPQTAVGLGGILIE